MARGSLKVYKDNTPLFYILEDGWSRGFKVEQTHDEALTMGYNIDQESIYKIWNLLTFKYASDMGVL